MEVLFRENSRIATQQEHNCGKMDIGPIGCHYTNFVYDPRFHDTKARDCDVIVRSLLENRLV